MDDPTRGMALTGTWPANGGAMGMLVRTFDWNATALGPTSSWPQPLKTVVQAVIEAGVPMAVYWGRDFILLYNDRWRKLLGSKHPAAIGRPAHQVFPEVWAELRLPFQRALRGDVVTAEDRLIPLDRDCAPRDAWFTFSASPIRLTDGSVGGVLTLAIETTDRVVAETRLRESAARNVLLLALDERLRGTAEPDEMMHAAAELMISHLRAARVGIWEADAAGEGRAPGCHPTATHDLRLTMLHRLVGRGSALGDELQTGRTVAIGDVEGHHLTAGAADAFAAMRCRAMACVPLMGAGRLAAVLFVLDEMPRDWTPDEVALIDEAAQRSWAAVERTRTEAALRASESRLLLAQEAAGIGVYERDLAAGRALWSPAMFRLWGINPEGRSAWVSDDEYLGLLVPEDEDVHRARRRARMDDPTVIRFSSEFRIRRQDNGEVRWIASSGEYVRDGSGRPVLARGTNQDVTDRRVAEERQAFLAREVDHRAKNALAVVQSVVHLTPADDPAAFKRGVQGRISALARAQTLLSEDRWRGADLRALLEGELAPFRSDGQRVTFDGPPVRLPPGMAQPMAMAFHELATNAVKHGSLSVRHGDVRVAWRLDDGGLHLTWTESGGPPLAGVPARRGFGSRVLQATVGGQLGGRVWLDWRPEGLLAELVVQLREGRVEEPSTAADRGA